MKYQIIIMNRLIIEGQEASKEEVVSFQFYIGFFYSFSSTNSSAYQGEGLRSICDYLELLCFRSNGDIRERTISKINKIRRRYFT